MTSEPIKQVKPRRARNSLDAQQILDAALLLASTGKDFSIRNVAAQLSCTPMALYRHFGDKEELLLALLDKVIGQVPLHADIPSWQDRLLRLAADHLATLKANPWAIPLLFKNPDPGPAVRGVGEAILSALLEGGASRTSARIAFSSILALNYGWAGFTSMTAKGDPLSNRLGSPPNQNDNLVVTSQMWGELEKIGSESDHIEAVKKVIFDLS